MYVSGIGGFFFRAVDPDRLRAWYAEHLGVGTGENGEWATAAGPSVFAPFPWPATISRRIANGC